MSLGFLLLFLAAGMGGGCGETTYESSAYYYPNWMPDGRIVCWKVASKWSEALFGRRELGTTAYITAMNPDGSNETNIFEDSGWGGEITCSPTGEMIGYIAGLDKLTIINSDGTNKRVIPNVASGATYFDWSPDATKIAYSASNKLYVINVDGTGNAILTIEASGPISWRVGNILSYGYLYIIDSDGNNHNKLITGAYPQNYSISEVVYLGADGVYKVNMDGTNNVKLFSGYDRSTLKLSFDNKQIVGGDFITGGGSDIGGIWVTNISDGISTKIR
jgi:hypothetical protein